MSLNNQIAKAAAKVVEEYNRKKGEDYLQIVDVELACMMDLEEPQWLARVYVGKHRLEIHRDDPLLALHELAGLVSRMNKEAFKD